jgi:hypothetical protein
VAVPFLRITSGIRRKFQVFRGYTLIKLFVVRDAPVGAIAELRCRGRGCPPKSKRLTSRGGRKLRFTSHLAGRRLRPGTVLEIRITLRDRIGKVVRHRMRAGRLPRSTVLCLPPSQAAPAACPPGT